MSWPVRIATLSKGVRLFPQASAGWDFVRGTYKNASGYSRTNYVRRSDLSGGTAGVIGSGGTLPSSMAQSTPITGLSYQVSYGVTGGRAYMDLRAYGTATNSSYYNLNLETARIDAANGQTWTASAEVALIAGSLANITQTVMQINENTTGGTYVTGGSATFTPTATPTLVWYTRTLSGGGTVGAAMPIFTFSVNPGVIDVTYRIFAPQMEQTGYPTSRILTTGAVGSVTTFTSTNPADVGNMTFTRASTGYAEDAQGNLVLFGSNVPRITSKGVLIEPAATNILLRSTDLSQWTAGSNASLTANYALAPDGTMTATRAQRTSTGGTNFLVRQYATVSAQAYTMSVYVRSNTGQNQSGFLRYYDNATGNSVGITATPTWQRVTFPITSTSSGSNFQFDVEFLSAGADVLVWGGQLETGAVTTSLIATGATTATRAADVFYYSGLSSLLSASHTLVAMATPITVTGYIPRLIDANDGTTAAAEFLAYSSPNLYANTSSGGGGAFFAPVAGAPYGLAMASPYPGTARASGAGAAAVTTSSATYGTLTRLDIGNRPGADRAYSNFIQRIALYPFAASDAQLQSISSGNF